MASHSIKMSDHCVRLISLFCILYCVCATNEARIKSPSAVITGFVYCDTCFHQKFTKSSHLISGASVAVECIDSETNFSFRKEVQTEHGAFSVQLPPKISKHMRLIKACQVHLLKSSEPFCAIASSATSNGLHLKSKAKDSVHVFSAGFFTFKPLQQPELCYQKPAVFRNEKAEQPNLPTTIVPNLPSSPPNVFGGFPWPLSNPLLPPPALQQPPQTPLVGLPTVPGLLAPPTPFFFRLPPWPLVQSPVLPGVPPVVPSVKMSP